MRVVMISSEHNYTKGSEQYSFILSTLQNTNRTLFPWLVITSHRAMYPPTNITSDMYEGIYYRSQLEDIFLEYRVSMGLFGHHHSYMRTCNVYNETCYAPGDAPVYLVIGMPGCDLNSDNIFPAEPYPWEVIATNKYYGFMYFQFINKTHLLGQFIQSDELNIIDQFYIINTWH